MAAAAKSRRDGRLHLPDGARCHLAFRVATRLVPRQISPRRSVKPAMLIRLVIVALAMLCVGPQANAGLWPQQASSDQANRDPAKADSAKVDWADESVAVPDDAHPEDAHPEDANDAAHAADATVGEPGTGELQTERSGPIPPSDVSDASGGDSAAGQPYRSGWFVVSCLLLPVIWGVIVHQVFSRIRGGRPRSDSGWPDYQI